MPAHHVEADDTEKEGVGFVFQAAPVAVLDDGHGATRGAALQPDGARARRTRPAGAGPEPIPGSEFDIDCDVIITAIGMAPDTAAFAGQVRVDADGRLVVDQRDPPDATCRGSSPPATSCPAPRTSPGRPARASAPRS